MKAFAMIAASALVLISAGASAAADSKSKTATVHTPESIECSRQADAKGLHGAERKTFRAKCKKELKGKATSTSTTPPAQEPVKKDAPVPAAKSQ
jgi:hypothetical protein